MCEIKKKLDLAGGITKGRQASMGAGGNYAYRGIDDIYAAICGLTADHGLAMYPRMVERQIDYQTNERGKIQTHYHVTMEIDLVSAVDNSQQMLRTYGESIDSGDKGSGKAQSYAMKMACIMAFQIPTHGEMDTEAFEANLGPAFVERKPEPAPAMHPEAHEMRPTHAEPKMPSPLPPSPAAVAVAAMMADMGNRVDEAIAEAKAKKTRGPNKPKDVLTEAYDPTRDAAETARQIQQAVNDKAEANGTMPEVVVVPDEPVTGRIMAATTFDALYKLAQETDGNVIAKTCIIDRAKELFAGAQSRAEVKAGYDLVSALGDDGLKKSANLAWARAGAAKQGAHVVG